jgi:hypothetical protein
MNSISVVEGRRARLGGRGGALVSVAEEAGVVSVAEKARWFRWPRRRSGFGGRGGAGVVSVVEEARSFRWSRRRASAVSRPGDDAWGLNECLPTRMESAPR